LLAFYVFFSDLFSDKIEAVQKMSITKVYVVMYQKDGQMKEYCKLQVRLPVEESYRDAALLRYNEEFSVGNMKNYGIFRW
jgi:hypothetical protein